jgi:hypothetical protein
MTQLHPFISGIATDRINILLSQDRLGAFPIDPHHLSSLHCAVAISKSEGLQDAGMVYQEGMHNTASCQAAQRLARYSCLSCN